MDGGRDVLAGRIPVTLLTGFLGAGKTTLLAKLVRHPDMKRVAVVINEVGEIGIDHDIVATASENISLLANGCICCSVRTDLQDTLRELFGQRRAGAIADFDRVVIETTGLADPGAGRADALQRHHAGRALPARWRGDAGRCGEWRYAARAAARGGEADRAGRPRVHHQERHRQRRPGGSVALARSSR